MLAVGMELGTLVSLHAILYPRCLRTVGMGWLGARTSACAGGVGGVGACTAGINKGTQWV